MLEERPHPEEQHELGRLVDLVIAVGGDGTILHVASLFDRVHLSLVLLLLSSAVPDVDAWPSFSIATGSSACTRLL